VGEEVRHIVLVGLMGAGKTSVGRVLAGRLGRPLSDSDEWILARTGTTVRELRNQMGVDAMHHLESEHLLDALEQSTPSVIAAAASVADDAACRHALARPGAVTVWLRGRPQTLAKRFDSSAHRPAFGADAQEFLAAQAASRYSEFEAISQAVVDVDEHTVEQAADAVMAKLGLS
jgi:shikimate kinase